MIDFMDYMDQQCRHPTHSRVAKVFTQPIFSFPHTFQLRIFPAKALELVLYCS
jgi:hypothetical protein